MMVFIASIGDEAEMITVHTPHQNPREEHRTMLAPLPCGGCCCSQWLDIRARLDHCCSRWLDLRALLDLCVSACHLTCAVVCLVW